MVRRVAQPIIRLQNSSYTLDADYTMIIDKASCLIVLVYTLFLDILISRK